MVIIFIPILSEMKKKEAKYLLLSFLGLKLSFPHPMHSYIFWRALQFFKPFLWLIETRKFTRLLKMYAQVGSDTNNQAL